jgi:SpoIID/LytB domain protein
MRARSSAGPGPLPSRITAGVAGTVASALVAATVTLTSAPAGAVTTDQSYWVPVDKQVVVHGHGYGHGHGMSQYGAYGAALAGKDHREILDFYYPGTTWSQVRGKVRVLLTGDTTADVVVSPVAGLTVRDLGDGTTYPLPDIAGVKRWRLGVLDGRTVIGYLKDGWRPYEPDGRPVLLGDGEFFATRPLTLWTPGGAKKYRGILRAASPKPGAAERDTVNVLPMDAYVRGVIPYEMPASWSAEAVQAQAVAARTYAAWSRAQNPRRYYQICDTTACQVYGGMAAEYDSTNTAVEATAGQILTYKSKPAFTQFSASSGGWTAAGSVPYLPAKRDPYDDWSGNGVHDWAVNVSAASLERSHPEVGRLLDVRVTRRDGNGAWGGRVQQVVLDGTDGKAYMTGDDLRWQYGLRSTWFSIDPTPIITRWRHLGGSKSGMGRPTSAENPVPGGSLQRFEIGGIYWSAKTGAREMWGPIFKAYKKFGGPDSRLGFARSGMRPAPDGGEKVSLQGGSIYRKRGIGAKVVYGAVMRAWFDRGGAGGWIGYPTGNVSRIQGGLRGGFEHAVITWDRSKDSITVTRR